MEKQFDIYYENPPVQIGVSFCLGKCDGCEWRFICYTTRDSIKIDAREYAKKIEAFNIFNKTDRGRGYHLRK